MELDFRNDETAPKELKSIQVMTINTLWAYCKSKAIDPMSVDAIRFAAGDASLEVKIGWAAAIAKKFGAVVHFVHDDVPVTAYPDTQMATRADYELRKQFGERASLQGQE